MNKIINWKNLNYLLLIAWLILVLFSMFHHEIWRDEARVWWFVRDLNIQELPHNIILDGHPFLWYLFLLPFAKMNFPLISMQIVSVVFVFASVYLFLFKSNFNIINKILFTFSAGMLYYIPVVARMYSFIPLLLFIIALLYPKRTDKPYLYLFSIFLLSQTHVYMWGLTAILLFLFFIEQILAFKTYTRKKNIKNFICAVFFLFYVIIMFLLYKEDLSKCNWYPKLELLSIIKHFWKISFVSLPLVPKIFSYSFGFLISFFILKINFKVFSILFFSILYILYIFNHVWSDGIFHQKGFLIILIFVFCCMILPKTSKLNNILIQSSLFLFFLIMAFYQNPFYILNVEAKTLFNNTKDIIDKMESLNIKENESFILNAPGVTADTFKAYNKYKGNNDSLYDYDMLYDKINDNPQYKYIIVNSEVEYLVNNKKFEKLITFEKTETGFNIFDSREYYYLYKIKTRNI